MHSENKLLNISPLLRSRQNREDYSVQDSENNKQSACLYAAQLMEMSESHLLL